MGFISILPMAEVPSVIFVKSDEVISYSGLGNDWRDKTGSTLLNKKQLRQWLPYLSRRSLRWKRCPSIEQIFPDACCVALLELRGD